MATRKSFGRLNHSGPPAYAPSCRPREEGISLERSSSSDERSDGSGSDESGESDEAEAAESERPDEDEFDPFANHQEDAPRQDEGDDRVHEHDA